MDNVTLANAVMNAIETHNMRRFLALFTADATVWDTNEQKDTPIADVATFMAGMPQMFKTFKYEERRYTALPDGAVLQHRLRGVTQAGVSVDLPAMLRMFVTDGKVTRLEEYYDTAHASAISGDGRLTRFIKDMTAAPTPEALNKLLSPNLKSGNLKPMYKDRDGFWEVSKVLGAVFPDYTQVDTHYIEQGNFIVRRIVCTATHSAQFMGVPATGKKIQFEGFELFEIVDGVVVEDWILPDVYAILEQIGATPETNKLGPKFGVL